MLDTLTINAPTSEQTSTPFTVTYDDVPSHAKYYVYRYGLNGLSRYKLIASIIRKNGGSIDKYSLLRELRKANGDVESSKKWAESILTTMRREKLFNIEVVDLTNRFGHYYKTDEIFTIKENNQ